MPLPAYNAIEKWVAFDVETKKSVEDGLNYGLQPWRAKYNQAEISTWAISWIKDGKLKNKAYEGLDRYEMSQFLTLMAQQKKTLITWKGTFDIAWLIAYGLLAEVRACTWLDAMILWKNLERNRNSYSLKAAVPLYFPALAGYEKDVDFEGDTAPLMEYNKIDTDVTLLLALKFWNLLTERECNALLIDMCDMVEIAKRNVEGIYINQDGLTKSAKMLFEKRILNLKKLVPHLETVEAYYARGNKLSNTELKKLFLKYDPKNPQSFEDIKHRPVINLDSNQQVAQLIFGDWQLPVYKTTPTGNISADKESLIETSHLDERALWVQQYRETTGLISKCIKAVIKSLAYNNPYYGSIHEPIVRPELNKSGTVTDRCTYSSFQKSTK